MITLEVSGKRYTQFQSAAVTIRMDSLCRAFTFQAASKDDVALPFLGGESCRVFINNSPVIDGYIEIVQSQYSVSNGGVNFNILVSGRDKLGDLVDSTLDSISELIAPISLKRICELVIEQLGLDIKVIDNVNPDEFSSAEDIISPEPGQAAFEFLEIFSRKRHVLLTTDGLGNLVIEKASGGYLPNGSLRLRSNGSGNNNVLAGEVSYDITGRFNVYKLASSMSPVALNAAGDVDINALVDQSGTATDPTVRKGRQLVLISDNPYSDGQSTDRAKWERSVRAARGVVYSATVSGFTYDENSIWPINRTVSVVDELARINSRMLINSVNFNYDLTVGEETILGLVSPDSYLLEFTNPKNEVIGSGLFQ